MTEMDKKFYEQTLVVLAQTISYLSVLNSGSPVNDADIITRMTRSILIKNLTEAALHIRLDMKKG